MSPSIGVEDGGIDMSHLQEGKQGQKSGSPGLSHLENSIDLNGTTLPPNLSQQELQRSMLETARNFQYEPLPPLESSRAAGGPIRHDRNRPHVNTLPYNTGAEQNQQWFYLRWLNKLLKWLKLEWLFVRNCQAPEAPTIAAVPTAPEVLPNSIASRPQLKDQGTSHEFPQINSSRREESIQTILTRRDIEELELLRSLNPDDPRFIKIRSKTLNFDSSNSARPEETESSCPNSHHKTVDVFGTKRSIANPSFKRKEKNETLPTESAKLRKLDYPADYKHPQNRQHFKHVHEFMNKLKTPATEQRRAGQEFFSTKKLPVNKPPPSPPKRTLVLAQLGGIPSSQVILPPNKPLYDRIPISTNESRWVPPPGVMIPPKKSLIDGWAIVANEPKMPPSKVQKTRSSFNKEVAGKVKTSHPKKIVDTEIYQDTKTIEQNVVITSNKTTKNRLNDFHFQDSSSFDQSNAMEDIQESPTIKTTVEGKEIGKLIVTPKNPNRPLAETDSEDDPFKVTKTGMECIPKNRIAQEVHKRRRKQPNRFSADTDSEDGDSELTEKFFDPIAHSVVPPLKKAKQSESSPSRKNSLKSNVLQSTASKFESVPSCFETFNDKSTLYRVSEVSPSTEPNIKNMNKRVTWASTVSKSDSSLGKQINSFMSPEERTSPVDLFTKLTSNSTSAITSLETPTTAQEILPTEITKSSLSDKEAIKSPLDLHTPDPNLNLNKDDNSSPSTEAKDSNSETQIFTPDIKDVVSQNQKQPPESREVDPMVISPIANFSPASSLKSGRSQSTPVQTPISSSQELKDKEASLLQTPQNQISLQPNVSSSNDSNVDLMDISDSPFTPVKSKEPIKSISILQTSEIATMGGSSIFTGFSPMSKSPYDFESNSSNIPTLSSSNSDINFSESGNDVMEFMDGGASNSQLPTITTDSLNRSNNSGKLLVNPIKSNTRITRSASRALSQNQPAQQQQQSIINFAPAVPTNITFNQNLQTSSSGFNYGSLTTSQPQFQFEFSNHQSSQSTFTPITPATGAPLALNNGTNANSMPPATPRDNISTRQIKPMPKKRTRMGAGTGVR
ncbi:hypothetical protein G9A89_003108 [Geosiphon pyriformis]|nr:hypothetical protein G9A89_003108 [Geosiphon pyriformis]